MPVKTPRKITPAATEKVIHSQIADWLNLQWPDIIFTSDPSGMRLSMGLRLEAKRKRCQKYKIPDLIILHPNKGYHGLCLEIKKDGEKLFKRNGEYASDHLKEQSITLLRLKELGYCASFAIGFADAVGIIKSYLSN
jgi:hypothetical protein